MTLPDWLARAAPSKLGVYLTTTASPRKSGLFVRHLCRLFADAFPDPRSLAVLDAADRFENGEIDANALQAALGAAHAAAGEAEAAFIRVNNECGPVYNTDPAARERVVAAQRAWTAAGVAYEFAANGYVPHAIDQFRRVAGWSNSRHSSARKDTAYMLRVVFFEHFGDTERPAAVDPAWLTEAVVGLARGMYAARDFAAMPVLADALDDAGCTNPEIIAHCREPAPHARGCWVVDLVLGKT